MAKPKTTFFAKVFNRKKAPEDDRKVLSFDKSEKREDGTWKNIRATHIGYEDDTVLHLGEHLVLKIDNGARARRLPMATSTCSPMRGLLRSPTQRTSPMTSNADKVSAKYAMPDSEFRDLLFEVRDALLNAQAKLGTVPMGRSFPFLRDAYQAVQEAGNEVEKRIRSDVPQGQQVMAKTMKWYTSKGIKRRHSTHEEYRWSFGQRIKNLGGYWCDEHDAHLSMTGREPSLFLNTFLGTGTTFFSSRASVEQLRDILDEVLEVWP